MTFLCRFLWASDILSYISGVEKRRFGWQDAATVVGAAGTVAFLFELLTR